MKADHPPARVGFYLLVLLPAFCPLALALSGNANANANAKGKRRYTVEVRDDEGNFIQDERVTFMAGSRSKQVRTDADGIASTLLDAAAKAAYKVRTADGSFDSKGRSLHIISNKYPITFKVRIDGKESTQGMILIRSRDARFNKSIRPGGTEQLPAGTYYFSYENRDLSHSETFQVRRRNNFVFEIASDPNIVYRNLYYKQDQTALDAAISRHTDPSAGMNFFLPRYWRTRLHLEQGDTAAAKPLLKALYASHEQWEKRSVKPDYIINYLKCMSEAGDDPELAAQVCRNPAVVRQINLLSNGADEAHWKFLFYYYRVTALDKISPLRVGGQKKSVVQQILTTFEWMDKIPLETLNNYPEKYGFLKRIGVQMGVR